MSDEQTTYYCELYSKLIQDCLQTNKEVFGKESPNLCMRFIGPYNKLCKK